MIDKIQPNTQTDALLLEILAELRRIRELLDAAQPAAINPEAKGKGKGK